MLLYFFLSKRGVLAKNKFVTLLKEKNIQFFNEINLDELNNQYILLNVYNIGDVMNILSLNTANKLQDKIIILDVLNDFADYDADFITSFIVKNNIRRPILNGKEFNYDNGFILFDKKGDFVKHFTTNFDGIAELLDSLTDNYRPTLLSQKENQLQEPFIKSLSFIKMWSNNIVVVDSKGKKIYITNLNGKIMRGIGDFCYPSAPSIKDDFLYVPDTCNNMVKRIALNNLETIDDFMDIKEPLAVSFLGDDLFVATSNGIYKNNEIFCEECKNILKLENYNDRIYFIQDGEIRYIDANFIINDTGITTDVSNFYVDDTGIYIVDNINNRIIKNEKTYSESELYNLPTDAVGYLDRMYIANENSYNILILNKITKSVKPINFVFDEKFDEIKTEEFLSVKDAKEFVVKGDKVGITFDLKEYALEYFAPQFLSLFKENSADNTAILVKRIGRSDVLDNVIKLPELELGANYYLKGSIFYKGDEKVILVNNFTIKVVVDENSVEDNISIDFK
ncbi:MAG: hypothetical protein LBH46_03260 [Rickettsiales bacterium]|nr:hypothetical protein [Rickettsiales bacterium]